jgi:hypothetical protein
VVYQDISVCRCALVLWDLLAFTRDSWFRPFLASHFPTPGALNHGPKNSQNRRIHGNLFGGIALIQLLIQLIGHQK